MVIQFTNHCFSFDMLLQGRKDLEEIKTALDSMTIARLTHEYVYKETHRPKDESVKPVTQ